MIRSLILAALVSTSAAAQTLELQAELRPDAPAPTTAAAAVAKLKAHYFSQDYEGADAAAPDLLARFGRNPEVRAWYVVNLARIRSTEALAHVDSTPLWSDPKSPWRTFARAFATYYQRDGSAKAVELAREFRKTNPWSRDAIWLQMYTLHGAQKYKEVVALADSVLARGQQPWGDLLSVKANALALQASTPADSAYRTQALATFAEARRIQPNHVNAHYLPAFNLSGGPTDTVTLRLMSRAAQLTPALNVHRSYWNAIRNRRDLSAAQKDSIVSGDVELLLAMRPRVSGVVRAAHDAYLAMNRLDRQQQLLARMRTEFANTTDMEWIDYNAISRINDSIFRKTVGDTTAARARHIAAIRAMSARPLKEKGIKGQLLVWQYSYIMYNDSTIAPDSLVRFAAAIDSLMPGHPIIAGTIARRVAERKGDFRWAERKVIAGDSASRANAEQFKDQMVRSEGVGAYADYLDNIAASRHAALGWIYMHEGRFADARKELDKALELQRRSSNIHYAFGKLAELQGQPAEAQAAYARGYPLESSFTGRLNRDALERIYKKNNGGLDGFDAYVERLKEEDRTRRKTKIAGERLTDGKAFPTFALERYADPNRAKFSSDSLKGKIAVVNFWGVWCGPCVKEIPEIQKFHERVKDDRDVVFLTVDYNDTPETLREFMVKQKLDFAVVLDAERFASDQAGVNAYPTTFFLDRDGKIAFKHIGASDVVLEEFLWRVEMLKGSLKP